MLPLLPLLFPKRVPLEKSARNKFGIKFPEDLVQFFSAQALLSNGPLKQIRNNLDGIFDDSTRFKFEVSGTGLTGKCFNRLNTIRKDHVNNRELLGLLLSPLLVYHYKLLRNCKGHVPVPEETEIDPRKRSSLRRSSLTQSPDITKKSNIPRNLARLGKFVKKFRVKFPVFRRFLATQGVGSALSLRPVSVCSESFPDILCVDDFANDSFFMSLYYFVTLFAKNDSEFNEEYFQNLLFEFFIKIR